MDHLFRKIEKLAWFKNIGQPLSSLANQINSWEEWLGPESELVSEIHFRQQALLENLNLSNEALNEWNSLVQSLVAYIKTYVPYIEGEDSYYAPNIAVWQAAWVFGLIELYKQGNVNVPQELVIQEYWFEVGHWPCAVQSLSGFELQNGYIVY